ncbi:hypothetical protein BJ138DRAFT_1008256 [Hygrophoropsis aurantiaca]|uniref:Uncharacterized protein n=1 Tax=Hygrophoropsis aurantiaca TaxID=72124 RepID=A0ACB8ABK7_9AGAM|nr:hypothetical protein BJ138DRAFT_1008256 [Hygrophoropsis aurantiaca]
MYEAHIAGERHRRKLAGSDVVYHCSVCDIYISKGVWDQHISGRPHTRRANEQGVSADIAPIIPDALPGLIFCSVCDKHIPERLWSSHSTILGHRKKEAYVAYKAATGEAEKDKHGVTVSDNMEFGIIEPAVASRGASKSLTIQTTIPSSRITIVSAKFSSSTTNSPSP